MFRSCLLLCFAFGASLAAGQEDARQIWDSGFRQKRPPAPATDKSKPPPVVDYRTNAARPAPLTPSTRVIGVTVWRLRTPPASSGNTPRLLVQETPASPAIELSPQRVGLAESLRVGDRIRIGIEAPARGYLYVINRERYADGTVGPPHLIFPARNLRNGDNTVEPGKLVEIPAQTDRVPALVVARRTREHVGEELLLVLASQLVPDLAPGDRERSLAPEVVQRLEQQYAVDAERLDLARDPAERWWTAAEKQAGVASSLLTRDDAMPEAIYRAEQKGDVVLVRVFLQVE